MGDDLQLASGGYWDFERPDPERVNIRDIAHALSLINRFNGHTRIPYSVATHSVEVARLVQNSFGKSLGRSEWQIVMQALLHDAPEAYLGDVTRNLKRRLPEYRALEFETWTAIAMALDVPVEISPAVHLADRKALETERRILFGNEARLLEVPPHSARTLFLDTFAFIRRRLTTP